MTIQDLKSLIPMVILAAGVLLVMILIALKRSHAIAFITTLVVISAAIIAVIFRFDENPHAIGDIFIIDRFGLYYQALLLSATFIISIFSYISLERFFPGKRKDEYYLLLMLATLGSCMMVISTHFISFFVSIETLTISLYALISYYRDGAKSIEAGLKYLILAAMSSSFLLFGMALIYAVSGTMSFSGLEVITLTMGTGATIMLVAGIALMIVGVGFELAVVPFHMWAPDVYEGASSPVSAFIATVSKGGVVALLLRLFMMADLFRYQKVMLAFVIIAVLSMLIGNLLALMQKNVKRILAYSSIAHLGYLLVAFIAGRGMGAEAATFYITIYIITLLGAFGLITLISQPGNETSDITDYQGLFWRKPLLAAVFTIFLLSLAGIPLTAGFIGKYFLLNAGLAKAQWLLAFVLIASSVIGLFYYLRLIVAMMKQDKRMTPVTSTLQVSPVGGILVLVVLGILIFSLGIDPVWLINIVNNLR
jgi:NADH-quinone oxidoreductase subunit N